ncbi:MAG: beta-ketoacyl synthase N-terminal-like domain-containing protein, partial [Desulfotignum sp.]
LVAIKLACEHLLSGRADVMVTGGVSRPDSLYTQIGFTQLAALSPSGRCAPFDRQADGLVVGEGCGILVLKRLEDALSCRDTIYGVISGWGVSNDIEGNLVAPASEGQLRAMTAAYDMAGLTPADLQYMECHGSGTPVGDKVELASIRAVLEKYDCLDTPLAIGSVKSNIGHLLTAAGAAGIIKTILAMNRRMLPPSCNFSALPVDHPLDHTRVQVQTNAEEWVSSNPEEPRRAGISAFGFGGINAHMLVEEFMPSRPFRKLSAPDVSPSSDTADMPASDPEKFAIVGMQVMTGDCADLNQFSDMMLGRPFPDPAPASDRWRRNDHLSTDQTRLRAGFLTRLSLAVDEFHIPPVQIPDILPQHLVLLKAAKGALNDAGISFRPTTAEGPRTRAGCAVGIDFDFGAADFSLRWHAHELDDTRLDQLSPPLTFNRTLGALGGIAASRVAREFKLGGPCFTISADTASGMKAIEVGTRSLAANETDWFICAAVDMAGDIRSFCLNQAHLPGDWARPSEGAAAIVIKRLADAEKDKDRIYAVIEGVSGGSGGPAATDHELSESFYLTSLNQCLEQTGISFSDLSFFNTHAGGYGPFAGIETHTLTRHQAEDAHASCVLGWTAGTAGDTRGVSGLISVIHTALCMNQRTFSGFQPGPGLQTLKRNGFVMPETPVPWPETPDGNRRAAAAAITRDGCAAFCLLASAPAAGAVPRVPDVRPHPSRPAAGPDTITVTTTRPPIPDDLVTILNPNPAPGHFMRSFDPVSMNPKDLATASEITARAHEKFLSLSQTNMDHMQAQFAALTKAAASVIREPHSELSNHEGDGPQSMPGPCLFTRDQCMEFAVGRAGRVLGPDFHIIDTYPVRVRLPDEPLMLVDRILSIEGDPCSLGPGKISTQHDVRPGAWYLDGGVAPVSISIEAGQADLFLCSYLGIDHVIKGRRRYRLLDAKVTFHRPLPEPGETIEYHICIDRFLRQG